MTKPNDTPNSLSAPQSILSRMLDALLLQLRTGYNLSSYKSPRSLWTTRRTERYLPRERPGLPGSQVFNSNRLDALVRLVNVCPSEPSRVSKQHTHTVFKVQLDLCCIEDPHSRNFLIYLHVLRSWILQFSRAAFYVSIDLGLISTLIGKGRLISTNHREQQRGYERRARGPLAFESKGAVGIVLINNGANTRIVI